MTLLIIGGALYAALMLFILGAMYVSGRSSDAEERRERLDMARMQACAEPQKNRPYMGHKDAA